MKKRINLFTVLAIASLICLAGCKQKPEYTVQSVKVISEGEETGETDLRFYKETPNIPYLGMNEYAKLLGREPYSIQTGDDGTCELENWNGAVLTCNAKEGTIYAEDWNAFLALPMPLEDRALGLKDMSVHYARMVDIEYEGEATPVTIDLAKYGIKLYSDQNDVYLPVSTLSNVMTDIATHHAFYNGENLYLQRLSLDGSGVDGLYKSEMMRAQINGEKRPEDIIKQCYADLCLNFDYFYGYPGKLPFEEALSEKGFDQALESMGEDGLAIKEGLHSISFADYVDAMQKLFFTYLAEGHTSYINGPNVASDLDTSEAEAFSEQIMTSYNENMLKSPITVEQIKNYMIPEQRTLIWGEDSYREYGNTAIIRLDDFMSDEDAWDRYYNHDGEFPQDSLGTVVTGLEKASDNPDIENVIFDLTCNSGGSPDVMMAVLALTTGQDRISGWNNITKQPMTVTFEIDANFDGKYDEKDSEARYDYNYGALVTRHAFSCGNLFPIYFQEGGAVLIGEPSSGGSCCIQVGTDAESLWYTMSSAQWHLEDADGVSVERGCSIDVPIETTEKPITKWSGNTIADMLMEFIGEDTEIPDFHDYYDDARLDGIMNEWFETEMELAPAA